MSRRAAKATHGTRFRHPLIIRRNPERVGEKSRSQLFHRSPGSPIGDEVRLLLKDKRLPPDVRVSKEQPDEHIELFVVDCVTAVAQAGDLRRQPQGRGFSRAAHNRAAA